MKYQSCLLMSAMAMATLGAQAKEISVISFGGANKDAQVKAYYQPGQDHERFLTEHSTF